MKSALKKSEIIEILQRPGSCIIGRGLSFGGTRWELYSGSQRSLADLIDGRIVAAMIKTGAIQSGPNAEYKLTLNSEK